MKRFLVWRRSSARGQLSSWRRRALRRVRVAAERHWLRVVAAILGIMLILLGLTAGVVLWHELLESSDLGYPELVIATAPFLLAGALLLWRALTDDAG